MSGTVDVIPNPNKFLPLTFNGSNTTGTGTGTTVSLPPGYYTNTYSIQLTYIGAPSGNQPLYVVSQTSNSFIFHGANSSPVYWTTSSFYYR